MSEFTTPKPQEVSQIKNFVKGGNEIRGLGPESGKKLKFLLLGLHTIVPQELQESGILNNKPHAAAVSSLLDYQVSLNDVMDFKGMKEPTPDLVNLANEREQVSRDKFDKSLEVLPEDKRGFIEEVSENAIREVTFIETWIRNVRDNQRATFNDVDLYRKLVNAVSTVCDVATIFGPEKFAGKLNTIPEKELTMQSIIDKYAWVFSTSPNDEIERATMIAFNTTMDVQVADDWQDRDIDEAMSIPSYGTAAILRYESDEPGKKEAKRFLKQIKDDYRNKAKELGLGKISADGLSKAMSALERAKRSYMHFDKKMG